MAIRQVVTALGICLSAAAGLLVAVECRAGGIPYAAEPQEDTPAPGRRLYTPNFSPPMTGYVIRLRLVPVRPSRRCGSCKPKARRRSRHSLTPSTVRNKTCAALPYGCWATLATPLPFPH